MNAKKFPERRLIEVTLCACLLVTNIGRAETVGSTNAITEARLRFAHERRPIMSHGIFENFRAETSAGDWWFPDFGRDGKIIPSSGVRFPAFGSNEGRPGKLPEGVELGTNNIFATNLITHVLARALTQPLLQEALTNGHFYVADDELCDSTSFSFGAVNNLGVFPMGDVALSLSKSRVVALTPLAARLRLFHEGALVRETVGTNLIFETKGTGAYRVEAWLTVDGKERPWIFSSPVFLRSPGLQDLRLPSMTISPRVERRQDISYRDGLEEDAGKRKLDLYVPKGKMNAPVFFFIHGGAWRTGDRAQYLPLGNRYASEGYLTVVPSYRLAPKDPHPAQIEDVAAAFAWTVRHVAEYGGDTNRIYVGGHSAGGHLAALLSLDERYLAAHQLSPKFIRGVLALSGVYNLTTGDGLESVFGKERQARAAAAPLSYVRAAAPPFLVSYCEWDYFSLPAQAREFHRALQAAGVHAELLFIPGESHISEMLGFSIQNDPFSVAALKFMNGL